MQDNRKNLPSLGSFATFEVAAKHLSFTHAARELNVTQAAVSQQIRYLESTLELPLFIRKASAIELTEEGRKLLKGVTSGLDSISIAISNIRTQSQSNTVTISTTNASAQLWLYPIVKRFNRIYPNVDVIILGSDRDESIQNFGEVDIAMICGNERCDPSENIILLFPEVVKPVCSPAFLSLHGPFKDKSSLLDTSLLHLHKRHWTANMIDWAPLAWPKWFGDKIIDQRENIPGFQTNSYTLLVEAAKEGEGILLGFQHLISKQLEDGTLSIAFDHALRSGRSYYLQRKSSKQSESIHVDSFMEFLLTERDKMEIW